MIGRNNPLNLRYSARNRWKGQLGHTRGFCDFSDPKYCFRAVAWLLMVTYRRHGAYTISQIIERYAPPVENPTMNYVGYVCRYLNQTPTYVPRTITDFAVIIAAMVNFEQGWHETPSPYNSEYVQNVIVEFKIPIYYGK